MSWGYVAVGAATLISGYMSSQAQKDAANKAANAQSSAANAGIEEQRRQFDSVQELLKPYNSAGVSSLGQQMALTGLGGADAQKAAIQSIESGPEMQAYLKQGENALMQNASATGGLRGGNLQAAMAQFRPTLLNQLIQQRYQNLAGMTTLGQNSAAMTGSAGMQTGNAISNLLGQSGAAQAGAAMATGQANSNFYNNMSNLIGMYAAQGNGTQSSGAATSSGGSSGGGGLLGGLMGGIVNLFSDPRLKENVVRVGDDPDTGLGLYEFNYAGDDTRWRGLMADEVETKYPYAVTTLPDGTKMVDYALLNAKMERVN